MIVSTVLFLLSFYFFFKVGKFIVPLIRDYPVVENKRLEVLKYDLEINSFYLVVASILFVLGAWTL